MRLLSFAYDGITKTVTWTQKNFSVILIPFVSELVILKGALIKYKTEMCTKLKLSLLARLSSRRQNNTFNDSQAQIQLLTPVYF